MSELVIDRISALHSRIDELRLHGKHNQKSHGNRRKNIGGDFSRVEQSGEIADNYLIGEMSDNWEAGLTDDQRDDLEDWVSGNSTDLQSALMGDNPEFVPQALRTWGVIETAPTFTGTIHRGLEFSSDKQKTDFVNQITASKGLHSRSLQSFSADKEVAENFADSAKGTGVMLTVKSRTGRAIMGVDSTLGVGQGESEVVSLPGSRYRLTGVKNVNRSFDSGHTRSYTEISLTEE
jgi:hypothetical protein